MPVVPRPPQRQNPATLAAAATNNKQANRVLYSVVVPAFGLVLLVLALRKGFNSGKHSRSAYAFIASLAVLSGLVGSLGSHAQVEAVTQALLSLFLCIPVLHLSSVYNTSARNLSRCHFIIRTLLKSLLFISLSSATLVTVLNPFLTSKLPTVVRASFTTTLFLAYTTFALCLVISLLLPEFFGESSAAFSASSRKSITIDIHVSTRRTVPINLTGLSYLSASEQHQDIPELDKFSIELAEHQKRPSVDSGISIISPFKPIDFVRSAQPSTSNSRQETNTIGFRPLTFRFRTKDLLVLLCLLLAELALCASYICKLAFDYKTTSLAPEVIHNSLKVVGIMASMKAYLLHAYNAHLGSLGLPASSSKYSSGTPPDLVSDAAGQQGIRFEPMMTPPIPPKSFVSPSSNVLGRRLRAEPSLSPCSNPAVRSYGRPQSTRSAHRRSILQMVDGDEKEHDIENGRLTNSVSLGSLKSADGTGGSEESDQTRVEGSIESGMSEVVGTRIGLKGIRQRIEIREASTDNRGGTPHPGNFIPKRLLGFGWLNGMMTNRYRESRGEKDSIDMGEQRCGMRSSLASSVLHTGTQTVPPTHPERRREPRKLKRSVTAAASFASMTMSVPSHPPSAFTYTYWNSDSTLCRTSSSDLETDMDMGNIVPVMPDHSPTRKLVKRVHSKDGLRESPDESRCGKNEDGNRYDEDSSGGLRLKRSFKLDDGRTLSPRLTLAATIAGEVCMPYINGIVKLPLAGCESNSGSSWKTEVKGRHGMIHADSNENPNSLPDEMGMKRAGRLQVRGATENHEKWEDGNKPTSTSSETPISPAQREGDDFEELELHSDSALVHLQKSARNFDPAPEKSRERSWMNIRMNIAQRPLEVSLEPVFISAISEFPIGESVSTITPASAAGRTTTVAHPSPPSEPASCSSSTTASPLVPDRALMIFHSSASDQSHEQRSREPFPLARISSSPSSKIQPALTAGTPTTPTRSQSTFSSPSSSSLRLSAVTIEGVRNAFSGVWSGKWSGRTGTQQSPVPSIASESINNRECLEAGMAILEDDSDGDFMDLRDPFASPRAGKVWRMPSGACAGKASMDSSEDGHGVNCKDVLTTRGGLRRKMNAWGRLPTTPKDYSHSVPDPGQSESCATTYSLTGVESTAYFSRIGAVPLHAKSKEHRKERGARKRIQRKLPMTKLPVLDDADLDVEEALLTQRLLKRLDDDMHGGVRL